MDKVKVLHYETCVFALGSASLAEILHLRTVFRPVRSNDQIRIKWKWHNNNQQWLIEGIECCFAPQSVQYIPRHITSTCHQSSLGWQLQQQQLWRILNSQLTIHCDHPILLKAALMTSKETYSAPKPYNSLWETQYYSHSTIYYLVSRVNNYGYDEQIIVVPWIPLFCSRRHWRCMNNECRTAV